MSAIFLPEDVRELLKGKTVIYIGDSVQRSMYKDLVLLFQDKRYLTDQELRAKGELCFLGDELMEGGKKGEMTNSTKYREVRKFLFDSQTKVLYFFITACFGEYIEMVLKKLMKPDIIFMNSCLWDVHRYGTKGYEGYGPNLKKLVRLLKELHPTVLFAWTTTPPVDIRSKAGFLEDRKDLVKINEVLRCNNIARQIMSQENIPIADFADVFRHFTHHRANDGVHWNERAHRRMTNILLETVARHSNRPVPRPVGDDFNRNIDFEDRPPFPHSYSQPAFHHNDSWGSVDEFNWYNDGYMNHSAQDDFILGLDRSYGYGNYSYFEMEDEMPQRYLPPPGRQMPPPHMRGPPPPPGYRFGSSEPGMMWEGRKRKTRDDNNIDGFSKRQHLEEYKRYPGSHDRRMPSPMFENKPKLGESGKSISPELDEKPAIWNSQTAVDKKNIDEKAVVTPSAQSQINSIVPSNSASENSVEPNVKSQTVEDQKPVLAKVVGDLEPNVESQTVEDQKPELAQVVGDLEPKVEPSAVWNQKPESVQVVGDLESSNEIDSVGNKKEKINLVVPPEEQKIANVVPHEEMLEKAVVQVGVSVPDGKEVSVATLAAPCKGEMPRPDTKPSSEPEKLASIPAVTEEKSIDATDKKVDGTKKISVFSKLSHTTSMILKSIQNSSKPVSSVLFALGKPDSNSLEAKQDHNVEEKEKTLEPIKAVLDEKTGTSAGTDVSLHLTENAAVESLGKNESEPSTANDAANASSISFYDIEESMDDLEASLDKMDDDGLMDAVDCDEESLLLEEDSDHSPTPNHVAKTDLEMICARQISRDGIVDKENEVISNQDPITGDGNNVDSGVRSEKALGTSSRIPSIDTSSLNAISDFSVINTVEDNDGGLSFKTQHSRLGSVKDTTDIAIESSKEETKDILNIVTSAGNLVSDPNKANAKANAPVLGPLAQRPVLSSMQHPSNSYEVMPSPTSKLISNTGVETTSTGPSVPPASNSIVVSSVTKSASVPPVTVLSGSATIYTCPFRKKATTDVKFDVKSGQSTRGGTNISTAPFGQVTTVTSKSVTVPIGTKTSTIAFTSLKTAASPTPRNTGAPIGTKTVTAPLGTKTTHIAAQGLSRLGGCNTPRPIIKSAPNAPMSVAPSTNSPSSLSSLPTLDTKQKLPCVPNPPSLDMKSPFYKPKLAVKSPEVSGTPLKSSVTKALELSTSIAAGGHAQEEQFGKLDEDSTEKSADKNASVTPSKSKTKEKKKKKIGKKSSKKAGKDGGENIDAGLKGVKDGGIKKKTKKDGKLKKKKLKDKNKNKSLCENKNVGKSSENVTQNVTPEVQHGSVSEPQSISIIATKDRPSARTHQSDAFSRNKQFRNQTVAPVSVNTISTFVPQGHQTFQQQQPLGNALQYFSNQQTFVPVSPQPQVVPVSQFPYAQQVFTNQNSALGYATGFNSLGANTVFGMNPVVGVGFQQVDYYGSQAATQINGMNMNGPISPVKNSASQPKEYQHLAWL